MTDVATMTLNGQRYRLVPIEDESKPAEEPKPERRPFPGFEIVDHDNDTLRVDEREDAETGCTYASVDVEGSKVYLDPTQLHQLALGALNAARWLKGLDEVSESVEAQCTFSPRRSVLVERSLCSQTGAISFISAGAERIGSHMFGEDTLTAAHRLLQLVVADEAKS